MFLVERFRLVDDIARKFGRYGHDAVLVRNHDAPRINDDAAASDRIVDLSNVRTIWSIRGRDGSRIDGHSVSSDVGDVAYGPIDYVRHNAAMEQAADHIRSDGGEVWVA